MQLFDQAAQLFIACPWQSHFGNLSPADATEKVKLDHSFGTFEPPASGFGVETNGLFAEKVLASHDRQPVDILSDTEAIQDTVVGGDKAAAGVKTGQNRIPGETSMVWSPRVELENGAAQAMLLGPRATEVEARIVSVAPEPEEAIDSEARLPV
jgi:hypothetical protein